MLPTKPHPRPAPPLCKFAAATRLAGGVQCRAAAVQEADVVVVGAGIIGISIARAILQRERPGLSVALLERHQPGYGATGAGQGYIWLAHRPVGSPAWHLAAHSKRLWAQEAASGRLPAAVEWQESGSLLVASSDAEAHQLEQRQQALAGAGVRAALLDSRALSAEEPALAVRPGMAGLLVASDRQINGRQAAAAWLEECLCAGARFAYLPGEGAAALELCHGGGERRAVVTDAGRRLVARRAIVLAAGAWTGQLLAASLAQDSPAQAHWREAFRPRKGHLLELQPPAGMPPVRHGLMELGYTSHYAAGGGGAVEGGGAAAITFTATASASGSLLLGSSREFAGFCRERAAEVEAAILARAAAFLPHLAGLTPAASQTRVGLRPFSPTGPIVGPLPGQPGVLIAGGHEGSGLTLAPATAEIIAAAIFEERPPAFAAGLAPAAPPATA